MKNNEQIAVERINNLNSSEFSRIVDLAGQSINWHYVGSNSKSSGKDAHWTVFKDAEFASITSSTYGNGEEYILIQETNVGLYEVKQVAASVIPFGDCLAGGLDPQNDEHLSQIIWNIVYSLPAHGGHTETILNTKLEEESKRLGIPAGEELITKVFSEAVAGWDIPI